MKARTAAAALLVPIAVIVLAACGRDFDQQVTGAEYVPGTSNVYRMCDRSTLIYFSKWSDTGDTIEGTWPGWCAVAADGTYQPVIGEPTAPHRDPAVMSQPATTGPAPSPDPDPS